MIKQVLSQGDVNYLFKLLETYISIKDDSETLKIACKLIQIVDQYNGKDKLILIFDTIYAIVSKKRKIFFNILNLENTESQKGNKRKVRYLKEFRCHLSKQIREILKNIINDLKKGITSISDRLVIIILI